jgi:hypothetical protein
MNKLLRVAFIMVFVFAVVLGGFWYRYVTNTESPYQEVGIELNSRMPEPIRRWGCDKLQSNFDGAVPPYGCSIGDGTSWI